VEARSLPKVGSYVHLDLERIVAAGPDLCIGTRDGNPPEIVNALDALGIPVYIVNPADLGTVVEAFLEIGRLLNASEKAEETAKNMRARIDLVRARAAEAKKSPRVFFQIGIVPMVSVGSGTYLHELITTAGGRNLGEGPKSYPRFSREQVLALEPEIIVITSMTRGQSLDEVKDEWKKYGSLPAVREDKIFLVESNIFDRPTPRLIDGLEILARIFHPDLF
ncbi:MAG: helical backbone metal receptor, partial [Syntrophobacteraceae bacterium]